MRVSIPIHPIKLMGRQASSWIQTLIASSAAMFPDVDEAADRLRLQQQALDLLVAGMRTSLMVTSVQLALVVWLLLPYIGVAAAAGPALLLLAANIERTFYLRRMDAKRAVKDDDPQRWARGMTWRVMLSGLLVLVWVHFVIRSGDETVIFYVLSLATILSAGAMTQFCIWPPAMWSHLAIVPPGIALQLVWLGGTPRVVGAAFFLLLALALSAAGLRFARALHSDMATRLHNERLARALDERRQQAEAANAAKSRFFAAASHDLRQPLQAMRLYLELLEHSPTDSTALVSLGESMEALDRVLASVLDLSRLDSGDVEPRPRAFAVYPLLASLAETYQGAARQKGLALRVGPTKAWAFSDPLLLERALSNLLVNAIRYTDRGGVLLGVRPHGDHLRLEVTDTGIGIASEAQQLIFEEFVQLENPQRDPEKGSGLGLATVRRIAEQLGHPHFLRSHVGRGSRFSIVVPRAAEDADALVEAPSSAVTESVPMQGHVLLVEDAVLVRDALAQLLNGWGLHVSAVSNAEQALHAMARTNFDVVLSDWRLPGTPDGLAVLQAATASLPALKLAILITGEDIQQLRATECAFPVLRKPVRPLRLRMLLASRLAVDSTASGSLAPETPTNKMDR